MTIIRRLADWLGGYKRLTCPALDCDMQIRFRGVTEAEAEHYRTFMANHTKQHTPNQPTTRPAKALPDWMHSHLGQADTDGSSN
jgi:hypothetical protein